MSSIAQLLLSLLTPIAFANFFDVPATHPYAEHIADVQERGIVEGYSDGSYGPNDSINRAEFTKIVIGATKSEGHIESCTFSRYYDDVPDGEWYTQYICTATAMSIVNGYVDNTFKPQNNINMAEASKIIAKSFGLPLDEMAREHWYEVYIAATARESGIEESFFQPSKELDRGEMAYIISSLMSPRENLSNNDSDVRTEMLAELNRIREEHDLAPFTLNETLNTAAEEHALDMYERNYFDHINPEGETPSDRVKKAGYNDITIETCNCRSYRTGVGENLLKATVDIKEAVNRWMNSPDHRKNILSEDYDEIGIAKHENRWVQVFGYLETVPF